MSKSEKAQRMFKVVETIMAIISTAISILRSTLGDTGDEDLENE